MSTEFGMALCLLGCVVVLAIDGENTKTKIKNLESKIEYLCNYTDYLAKRIDHNSESCSQVNDLGIEIKVCQKDIEHALEMTEDLKAQRSMDILDRLREEDKE